MLAAAWPQYGRLKQGPNCSIPTYAFCLLLVKIPLGPELRQAWSSALAPLLGAPLRGV